MGLVNLKEMAKRAKMTEEEVMALVDSGVIKPQKSYCHPALFGDGREIAFYPEEALADIEAEKAKAEIKVPPKDPFEKTRPEEPGDDQEEGEEAAEPEAEEPEPEPEPKKEDPKVKDKKTGKK